MKRCYVPVITLFTIICTGNGLVSVLGLIERSFVPSRSTLFSRYPTFNQERPRWRHTLSMHMGHSHSHHDHQINHSLSNTNPIGSFEQFMATVQEFRPRQFIFRRRRLVAMIVVLAGAILGPPVVLKQHHSLGRSEWTIFGVAVAAVTAAEPLRNAVWQWIQRLRSLQQGIANHSAPITASYLFANKNAADRVTLLGGCMNIILSIAKLAVGITCHSTALIADAGHSLSDLFSDVVTLWAVHVARLPPDQDHPYGHGKFEAIGALFLSLTLIVTSLTVGMASNAKLLQLLAQSRSVTLAASGVEFTAPSLPALFMAVISIVSKEWLFRITRKVGHQLQSTVVIANAWHHRSDAYSSVLAAASIGLAMYVPGFIFADASAGLFVAAMIGMTGMEILGESVLQLTDTDVTTSTARDDRDHNHHHDHTPRGDKELVFLAPTALNTREDVDTLTDTRLSINGDGPFVPDATVAAPTMVEMGEVRHLEGRLRNEIFRRYDHLIELRSLTVAKSSSDSTVQVATSASTRTTITATTRFIVSLSIQVRPESSEKTGVLPTAKTIARDIRQEFESNSALSIEKVHISLDLNDE